MKSNIDNKSIFPISTYVCHSGCLQFPVNKYWMFYVLFIRLSLSLSLSANRTSMKNTILQQNTL